MILSNDVFDEGSSCNESQQRRSWRPFESQRFSSRCTTQQRCRTKGVKKGVLGSAAGSPHEESRKRGGERVRAGATC